MSHSSRQLKILKQMGVDVWTLRTVDHEEVPPDLESKEFTEIQEESVQAGSEPSQGEMGQNIYQSLEEIEITVRNCQRCELHQTRKNTVFGNGRHNVKWMFVGEAPGQQEDEQGQPFVGRAGKLLDMMIAALGMERPEVYVANVLKCRPPGNRDPLPQEIVECEQYLKHQLEFVKPKVIVALGRISAQALLKTTQPLGRLRNQVYHYGEHNIPLIATYHPAYLLRSPDQKVKSWEDLWLAKTIADRA